MLSVDETILAFLSTVSGLCKVCGLDPPLNSEVETVALMVSEQTQLLLFRLRFLPLVVAHGFVSIFTA